MVLTAVQVTAFFTEEAQMGLLAATRVRLQKEGLTSVDDLLDFLPADIKQLAETMKKPGGRIADPNDADATIPTPPFPFGAKSQKRLAETGHLVRYYQTTGRDLTAAMLQYAPIGRNFSLQWQTLEEKKKADKPVVPKLTRELGILSWTESFTDYLAEAVGCRCIPLAYVIRQLEVINAADRAALAHNKPHTNVNGSVAADMITYTTHDHPLFTDNNRQVYFDLVKTLHGTVYASSLKPYQKTKDRKGAFNAVVTQYTGIDKWDSELKRCQDILFSKK